jgi:hypothetical protein
VAGVIYDTEYYHEVTLKIWKKTLYQNGTISEELIDKDFDGKYDTKIEYNKYGRQINMTSLTK